MLPSTALDACTDRVLVDFPVSGHCNRGFFPDSVSERRRNGVCVCDAGLLYATTQVCATVRGCFSQMYGRGKEVHVRLFVPAGSGTPCPSLNAGRRLAEL